MAKNFLDQIKTAVKNSGSSKKDILYFGADTSKRIRFLQELDDGHSYTFHSDFETKIYEPCQDQEDHEDCKLCQQGIATKEVFVWSVYDYDTSSVKLLAIKATGISPVPALIEFFEEYGTIMDRDYKIKKVGKGMGGSYTVTPLDKEKFGVKKAKPYSEKEIWEMFKKAYSSKDAEDEDEDDEEEEEEVKPTKKSKKAKKAKSLKDKYLDLDWDEVRDIALEIGMTKKELKAFDEDVEELVEELFDNYDEEDLEDMLED
jgi:hypothetical protein